MKYISCSVTDIGKNRATNQDRFVDIPEMGLFIVADGMGGGKQGELAAQIAVDTVYEYISDNYSIADVYKITGTEENRKQVLKMLVAAVIQANFKVYQESLNDRSPLQMGTTFTLFMAVKNTGFMIHVGDSRFYLIRNGEVSQISTDHTIKEDYISKYGCVPEGIDSSYVEMLTKAVGINEFVEPEKIIFDILPGDRILLCSDGVHRYFSDHNSAMGIQTFLSTHMETDSDEEHHYLEKIVNGLVAFSYSQGAVDNITAVLVSAVDTGEDDTSSSKDLQEKFDVIRNSSIFRTLSYSELLKVMEKVEIRTYNKYDIIMVENRVAQEKELLLLLEGQVSILKNSKLIAVLKPGEHIGEMSMLDDLPRVATVFVDKPSTFLVLKKAVFMSLSSDHPEIGVKLLWEIGAALSRRLRTAHERLDKS